MSRITIQAAVTMNQLQQKLDLIGNNLANSQTTGYKNRQAEFSSLLFQQIDNLKDPANANGRLTPEGIRVGSGARLGATTIDLTVGSIKETGRALDTALLGENQLFQIQVTDNGVTETRYTRDGAFYLSPQDNGTVMLVTAEGNPVLGTNGPIVFQDGFDDIEIRSNGDIYTIHGNRPEFAGQLSIVEATLPRMLEAAGDNTFRLGDLQELGMNFTDVIQNVDANTSLLQSGALESSNVDVAKEMTDLLMAQRSYQFNARTISMSDQMMGLVNQLK